jgi:mono/diheme cytochrome c family protein
VIVRERLLRTLRIAAAVCAVSSLAHAQTPATIARGRELSERACGGCHAIEGGAGSTIVEGTNVPSFSAIAGRSYVTHQQLQSFIMTPHRPMPGMSLSLSDVDAIVAYILSLR